MHGSASRGMPFIFQPINELRVLPSLSLCPTKLEDSHRRDKVTASNRLNSCTFQPEVSYSASEEVNTTNLGAHFLGICMLFQCWHKRMNKSIWRIQHKKPGSKCQKPSKQWAGDLAVGPGRKESVVGEVSWISSSSRVISTHSREQAGVKKLKQSC